MVNSEILGLRVAALRMTRKMVILRVNLGKIFARNQSKVKVVGDQKSDFQKKFYSFADNELIVSILSETRRNSTQTRRFGQL